MDNSPHHAFLLLSKDHFQQIHFLEDEDEIRLTWSFLHEVTFNVKSKVNDYMVKIALNCFEAAYATIALINEDITDDFEVDLCEQANPNSTICLFHDVTNSRIMISVDDAEFETMIEDERLGTEKF